MLEDFAICCSFILFAFRDKIEPTPLITVYIDLTKFFVFFASYGPSFCFVFLISGVNQWNIYIVAIASSQSFMHGNENISQAR